MNIELPDCRSVVRAESEVNGVYVFRKIDPAVRGVAARIVEIQRAAYSIEADLIGFDGIPQLIETAPEVRELVHMSWMGAFADDVLVGLIAWETNGDDVEIDRLAVGPRLLITVGSGVRAGTAHRERSGRGLVA